MARRQGVSGDHRRLGRVDARRGGPRPGPLFHSVGVASGRRRLGRPTGDGRSIAPSAAQ